MKSGQPERNDSDHLKREAFDWAVTPGDYKGGGGWLLDWPGFLRWVHNESVDAWRNPQGETWWIADDTRAVRIDIEGNVTIFSGASDSSGWFSDLLAEEPRSDHAG